jgi:proteasome activator subunit 4
MPDRDVSDVRDIVVTTAQNRSQENEASLETGRFRPRTYPYFKQLPYKAETQDDTQANLNVCLNQLYIAVSAGDFNPGVVHWTREIRGWLGLKFDMPRDVRVKLVQLYYGLALAPGLDNTLCERFASMFMFLTK